MAIVRSTRPPPPPSPPPPHSRFGPYTLVNRIAVGGMAELFRGLEPRAVGEPRVVVIKRMLPHVASDPNACAMFEDEARIGQLVRHKNVIQVLGFGNEEGQPYLALEYVRGVDLWRLTRWLTRSGKTLGVQLSLFVVRELLEGLHEVHSAHGPDGQPLRIVHRDVSPSNILLSVYGDVKLGDFGIARSQLRQHYAHTHLSDRAKGKLGYLAPEQVTGQPLDQRTDMFSVGVIAAELLMGRPLFAGGSELAVLLAVRDAKIHPFLEIVPTLPRGLGEIIAHSLLAQPCYRLPSADEFLKRLAPFQTESEATLRAELAQLVSGTLGEVGSFSASFESSDSVAPAKGEPEIVETWNIDEDRTTPRVPPPDMDAPTNKIPHISYYVQTSDGHVSGPAPYAEVAEAISTGRVSAADRVSVGGEDFRSIAETTELRRHLPPSTFSGLTKESEVPSHPHKQVPLANGGFITALGHSVVRKETGLWLCELDGVRKEIYIHNGAPEFVTSNLAGELLGEHLVTKGVITRGELDMALAVMPRFEGRLGDTLTALGLVEALELFQHIAAQVREKLLDLFLWETGTASFYRGVPPPASGFPLNLDPWQILDEGIGRRLARGLEEDLSHKQKSAPLERVEPFPDYIMISDLPENARNLVELLQAPRSIGEITSQLDDPEQHDPNATLRVVVLLLHLGVIRWATK